MNSGDDPPNTIMAYTAEEKALISRIVLGGFGAVTLGMLGTIKSR